jgi:hypothetical protein
MDSDPEVGTALREFWRRRFDGAATMLQRAADRGEIPAPEDPHRVIEQLIAPAYLRAFVTGQPLDDELTRTRSRLGSRNRRCAQR